jgi:hypothetical protein
MTNRRQDSLDVQLAPADLSIRQIPFATAEAFLAQEYRLRLKQLTPRV